MLMFTHCLRAGFARRVVSWTLFFLGLGAVSLPAGAQLLDDKINLKVLTNRAMLLQLNKNYFDDLLKQQGAPTSPSDAEQYIGRVGCGSVEIGNQYVDTSIAHDISVVIVGDVINVGNRCGR